MITANLSLQQAGFSLHSEFLLSKYNNLPEPVVISLQILCRCGKVLPFINHSLVILQPRYARDECIAVYSLLSRIMPVFSVLYVTVIANPSASFRLSKCQSL